MSDNASHYTVRAHAEVASFITALNDIWTKQANVLFESSIVDDKQVPRNLEGSVDWYSTEPANEWDDVVAYRTGGPPDVFFVWEYWQEGSPDSKAAHLNGDILFQDIIPGEGRALAHEMGHYLGLWPKDYTDPARIDELMYKYTSGGPRILHSQVDQANP